MSWKDQEFREADDVYTEFDDLDEEYTTLNDAVNEARDELESMAEDESAERQGELHKALGNALEELADWESKNLQRHADLKEFTEALDGYAGGRKENETLIDADNFAEYAEQFAEDTSPSSDIDFSAWPLNCIDWEKAAKELRYDYTEHEFQGTTYLFRCY